MDKPMFTQPLMYKQMRWQEHLLKKNTLTSSLLREW